VISACASACAALIFFSFFNFFYAVISACASACAALILFHFLILFLRGDFRLCRCMRRLDFVSFFNSFFTR
jgi:hypothetical protein